MKRLRKTLSLMVNAGLQPLGGEVVRAGLVDSRAATINSLQARLNTVQAELRQEIDRAQATVVEQALALSAAQLPNLMPAASRLAPLLEAADRPAARDIFTFNGRLLPCWRESDLGLYDDWLTHPRNYPMYYALFRQLSAERPRLRLLEIGVRTGYLGTAFARAVSVPAYYVGLDPNLYMADGLEYAAATYRLLRDQLPTFNYALWEGYSWRRSAQVSLEHCGPYDVVHIDGDHSLAGKLVDLDLARRLLAPDGLVLVDDFKHHAPVADAIRRALRLGWYQRCDYIDTMRGLAVLVP